MPRRCAFGCEPSDVPMHRFPNVIKFSEIFQSWVSLVGGKLESTSDYEYYKDKRICDIHFTDKDRTRNNRICKESIPSLHIPGQLPDPKALEQTSTSVQQTQSIQLNSTKQLESSYMSEPAQLPGLKCTLHDKEISKHILFEHNYCITNNPRRFKGKASYNVVPLNAKFRQLRSTISRLRKKGQSFQTRLRNSEMLSKTIAFQNVTKNMTKSAQLFVQMQMQTLKKPKGRRFSNEEKDARDALILSLKREVEVLQAENHHLRSALHVHSEYNADTFNQRNRSTPSIETNKLYQLPQSELVDLVQLHMAENSALRQENTELFVTRDQLLRDQELLSRENERLLKKLEDVNSVCTRSPIIPARPTYSDVGTSDSNIWTNTASSADSIISESSLKNGPFASQ